MAILHRVLILIFLLISYLFYVKYNRDENAELVTAVKDLENTECPFGVSLYRVKTPSHAYRIQIQTKLPHNPSQQTTISKGCEKEPTTETDGIDTWSDDAWSDYQAVDESTVSGFDSSCHAVEHGAQEDENSGAGENRWAYFTNALASNRLLGYFQEIVKWPESSVQTEAQTASEVWSVETLSRGIYPGTLWCGFGNVAEDKFGQLGEHEATDACCRSHDLCRPIIKAFETRYHYSNPHVIPVSHCACDASFYTCLLDANTVASRTIGNIFFNLIRMKCFDFDVRDVCTSTFLGLCRSRERKCVAVIKNNRRFPS